MNAKKPDELNIQTSEETQLPVLLDIDYLQNNGFWTIVDGDTNTISVFNDADKFGDSAVNVYETTAGQIAEWENTDAMQLIIVGTLL